MSPEAGPAPPKVTVLLPVYNSAPFLRKAVDSILVQTWRDFELLAIDDGSTDGSLDILRAYSDPRIRLVAHERNQGLVASLNEGLDLAKGAYIARMDADDIMLPERLAWQAAHLDAHPEIALVAGMVAFMNRDGAITGTWDTDQATPDEASVAAMLPRTNCIAHPTVMLRRSALGGLRYAPRHGAEDWDLWLRMRSRGLRLDKLPRTVLHYRVHPGSITATDKRTTSYERRLLRTRWQFLAGEWSRMRFSPVHMAVLKAQARTRARHLRNNVALPFLQGAYRLFTYSPVRLLRERTRLLHALASWEGKHVFTFPYLNTGGAEQVHADIMATVADQRPLILIEGFSKDPAFAGQYARMGTLVEIPRLLHHPFTGRWAKARIAQTIGKRRGMVLFGAISNLFFDLVPHLDEQAKAFQLIHAFLYQPGANHNHRRWLRWYPRVDRYLFVSRQAMAEYREFLFRNNIPEPPSGKLEFTSNAVHGFGEVRPHERLGLLFVGRDSPEKRLPVFLKVADALEAELPGRFRFTVVGSEGRGGHPHVNFRGNVRDRALMDELYGEHDLLLLTSSREGFPMVVMEAMAQGLAVLATPVGDIPQRLSATCTVITSTVAEQDAVAEMVATVRALGQDRNRLLGLRFAALEMAKREFSLDRFNQRYRELLMQPAS